MIIPLAGFSLPMAIYLFSSFYEYIPRETYEAASLDGAGPYRIFAQITLPAVARTRSSRWCWSTASSSGTTSSSPTRSCSPTDLKTIPLGLQNYIGAMGNVDWTATFAARVRHDHAAAAGLPGAQQGDDPGPRERGDQGMSTRRHRRRRPRGHSPRATGRRCATSPKAAGVSVATVSHVVNDKPNARIGEAARERVRRRDRGARLPAQRPGQDPRQRQLHLHRPGRRRDRDHPVRRPDHPRRPGRGVEARLRAARGQHRRQRRRGGTGDRDDARAQGARHPLLDLVPPGRDASPALRRDRRRPGRLLLRGQHRLQAVVPDEVQGGRSATQLLLRRGPPAHRVHQHHHTPPLPRAAGCRGTGRCSRPPASRSTPRWSWRRRPTRRAATGPPTRRARPRASTAVFCHNDRVAMGLYDGLRETRSLQCPTTWPWSASTTRRSSPRTSGRR